MDKLKILKENMIKSQVQTVDIFSPEILDSIEKIDRHLFVDKDFASLTYIDSDIKIAHDRFMFSASTTAKMLKAAEIKPTDKVLDIAVGKGYSSMVIANLCSKVIAIDSNTDLISKATKINQEYYKLKINFITSDNHKGYVAEAPYDVIIIEGLTNDINPEIFNQLKIGGRLVTIESRNDINRIVRFIKSSSSINKNLLNHATGHIIKEFYKTNNDFEF